VNVRKILFYVVLAVVAIGGGTLLGIRGSRGSFSQPAVIKPGICGLKSGSGVFVFGAKTDRGVILFDTSADPAGKPVDAVLGCLGASRPDIRDAFVTHGHFDHISGAASLAPEVKIHIGAGDVDLAGGISSPEGIAPKLLALVMRPPAVKATDPMTGMQTFDVGGGKTVKALPVPGHTPGSFAFLYDGVLFAGDVAIAHDGKLEPTPSAFDPRPDQNRASIRALRTQLAGDRIETVCTGHGGCTPLGFGSTALEALASRVGSGPD
jgi:glyoxylase-like metal-dependent hydrolase (beta-lactamase superfamily II)